MPWQVRYWESDRDISEANETKIFIGNKLEATINDLTPGKTYFLRVLAYSQGGEGKMSSPAWQFQMGDPEALNSSTSRLEVAAALSLLAPAVLLLILGGQTASIDRGGRRRSLLAGRT